jgi:4-amino-4-deoxy-L-arabinose transferase-like glycosyltransferase
LNEIRVSNERASSWQLPISAAAVAICLFGNLGALGLVGPDEPRYVWIARAVAETGDWVTPRLYGQPWFEKPILYYWAAALGFLLHLPAEWAARVPSACAALAAALAIGWLAKKHYGGDANSISSPVLLAPVLFSTSVAAIGFARAATPDMLFSALIVLAMACAATIFRNAGALRATPQPAPSGNRGDGLAVVLFGAFLGAAVLAKGPAAVILAGGAIGLWALATKQWRAAFRVAHPLAIVAFCVVALPWYILCARRNADFLRVFLWQHNFERYTTGMFQHRQPFWYFGPILFAAILPWLVTLWPAAQEGLRIWRDKSWTNSSGFFFACWAIFPVLFFSASQSKLPGYILPAMPPLALLCAVAVARAISGARPGIKLVLTGIAGTWIALGVAGAIAAPRNFDLILFFNRLVVAPGILFAAIPLAAAGILLFAAFRRKPATAVLLCAALTAGIVEFASLKILPVFDSDVSARPHAEFMHNDQHPDRIFTYELSRSWNWGLAFYFRRELPEWLPSDSEPALVLTTSAGLKQIEKLGRSSGDLEETQPGLVYVPIAPAPISR